MIPSDALDNLNSCTCLQGDFSYENFVESVIGSDKNFADVSILRCKKCNRQWLRYYYVQEAFTKSGRWFHGIVEPSIAQALKADDAMAILENLEWYYAGGSYFEGKVRKTRGKLDLST